MTQVRLNVFNYADKLKAILLCVTDFLHDDLESSKFFFLLDTFSFL